MKKALSIVATAALLAMATTAMAGIQNSKHDLSINSTGSKAALKGNTTQICVYCHTPHNAYTQAPLWNRNMNAQKAASTYLLYSGQNMANKSYKTGMTEDSVSLFCMSCHDGSSLGGLVKNAPKDVTTLDTSATIQSNSPAQLYGTGTQGDMRNTHPINFEVVPGSETIQSDLKVVANQKIGVYPLFKSSRSPSGYTLECSSCHSVHDTTNTPFLRTTMNGSALCLGCHSK